MGTRSLISGQQQQQQSKPASERRMGFGHLEVKKEFRIKKETPDDEIKEYAETAMNELLGWYGYDKVDSRDTQGLNLHHFAASKMASGRRSPSDADSSDAEGPRNAPSPGRRDGSSQGSPSLPDPGSAPAGCIICSWCNKIVSHKMFSLKTPGGEKSFCSEICFAQCRRANFKRNKTCDWCRHIRHTVNYVDFQDGEHQLQFCSDKCLNQYKMNIFCKETEAHLQLHPHLQGLGSGANGNGNGSASVRLITPELWLRDCRSESPASDRSPSPPDNPSPPLEIKVVPRPPNEPTQPPALKPPPPSLEITKIEKREKPRKTAPPNKSRRRCLAGGGDRRAGSSSSSPRSGDSLTPPKPFPPPKVFPPPLLPLNARPPAPPEPALLRPPFLPLPLSCFPPAPLLPPDHPLHRPSLRYDPLLRPRSPSAPTVINPPTRPVAPPPPPPPPPHAPPSLLPPVTVLVPYPIPLAIPIPLPIPIPIPLLPPEKLKGEGAPAAPADAPSDAPKVPPPAPPSDPSSPTPPLPAPRPLRKRKRLTDLSPEEENLVKRKTVPV